MSSLATSIAILGLDNGLVRFATKVRHPRRLIQQLVLITGLLGTVVGLALPFLGLGAVASDQISILSRSALG